jgi:hypothetical protein
MGRNSGGNPGEIQGRRSSGNPCLVEFPENSELSDLVVLTTNCIREKQQVRETQTEKSVPGEEEEKAVTRHRSDSPVATGIRCRKEHIPSREGGALGESARFCVFLGVLGAKKGCFWPVCFPRRSPTLESFLGKTPRTVCRRVFKTRWGSESGPARTVLSKIGVLGDRRHGL